MAKFSQSKQVIFRSDLSVVPNIYDLPKLGAVMMEGYLDLIIKH